MKREKRLALLRAEAEAARLKLELTKVEEEEQALAAHDIRVADVIEHLEEGVSKSTAASACSVLPPSVPSTDLGWSQVNPSSNPLFFEFLRDFPGTGLPNVLPKSPLAISCSS